MNKHLRVIKCILLLGIFLSLATAGTAQVYQNGLQRGAIKVKFKTAMTPTLERVKVSGKGRLSTGMTSFDVAAARTSATNMHRMFPFDPRHENKLRKHGLHLWYI